MRSDGVRVDADTAVRLYRDGLSLGKICEKLGVSREGVRASLIRRGVVMRDRNKHQGRSLREVIERLIVVNKKTGCWECTQRMHTGYGRIRYNNVTTVAHRWAWITFRGEIPNGMLVCHKCDNPPCCNPDHLFLGTYTDNLIDAVTKGRHTPARLTPEKVRRIRLLYSGGIKAAKIASIVETTERSVWHVIYGQTWSHVK